MTFWCSESCPLFGVSFNGGSTVLLELYIHCTCTMYMYKRIGYCTCTCTKQIDAVAFKSTNAQYAKLCNYISPVQNSVLSKAIMSAHAGVVNDGLDDEINLIGRRHSHHGGRRLNGEGGGAECNYTCESRSMYIHAAHYSHYLHVKVS